MGAASATIEVAIDNNRIEQAVGTLHQDAIQIAQSPQDQQYEAALKDAGIRADLEIRQQ